MAGARFPFECLLRGAFASCPLPNWGALAMGELLGPGILLIGAFGLPVGNIALAFLGLGALAPDVRGGCDALLLGVVLDRFSAGSSK